MSICFNDQVQQLMPQSLPPRIGLQADQPATRIARYPPRFAGTIAKGRDSRINFQLWPNRAMEFSLLFSFMEQSVGDRNERLVFPRFGSHNVDAFPSQTIPGHSLRRQAQRCSGIVISQNVAIVLTRQAHFLGAALAKPGPMAASLTAEYQLTV